MLSTHACPRHHTHTHTEELSDLMGAVDSACEEGDALKKMSKEAQHWTNKLDMAEQSVQGDDII